MENFEFCIGVNILFGKNQVENLPSVLSPYGKRCFFVTAEAALKNRTV